VEEAVYGAGGCISGGKDLRLTDKEVAAFS
jgi:hypothetical protein